VVCSALNRLLQTAADYHQQGLNVIIMSRFAFIVSDRRVKWKCEWDAHDLEVL